MTERETVKQEIARLREHLRDIQWEASVTGPEHADLDEYARIKRRIDYLTREYVARDIEYEPNF